VAAKRLLDAAKQGGFRFVRVAPGPDGPLGVRETLEWRDTVYLAGFGRACIAIRAHERSLILPSEPLVTHRIGGDAISVLHTVVCEWKAGGRSSIPASALGGRSVTSQAGLSAIQ
jgi:hypothetical protein